MIGNTDIRRVARLVPLNKLADQLPDLQKTLAANQDAVVAVTCQGKPVMALLSWDAWEDTEDQAATMETLEIVADTERMAILRQSKAEADVGNLIPSDVALQQLIDKGLIDPNET